MDEQNNFSDIPALGDVEGLNAYLDNEALKTVGVQQETQQPAQEQPQTEAAPAQQTPEQGFTQSQVNDILSKLDSLNSRVDAMSNRSANQEALSSQYSPNELNFVRAALNKGYSMDAINRTILTKRNEASYGNQRVLAQRLAEVENYLKNQEYKQAETAFIDKVSAFGDKWGLSENDIITFANAALSKGINIATGNVDLETVFRAVYPEQYAIRMQRMAPTNSSQIYGGTSIPEGNRAQASRMEDAYVEAFMKSNMPNYGK